MIQFPYRVHEQHKAALRCCPVLLPASVDACLLQAADGLNSRYHVISPARSCLTAWIAGAACDQHRACRRLVVGVQVNARTHDRCCVKLRDGSNVGNGVAERPHTIGGLLGGLAVRVQVGILCGRCVIGSVHWRLSDVDANHHENLVRWRAGLWWGVTLTQPRVVRHLEPTGTARLPRSHSSRLGRACHAAPRRHH